MWRYVTVAVGAACLFFTALVASEAADLSKQEPINVVVQLGNEHGDLVFQPDKLTFETGKLYKLILINPSNTKHYLSGPLRTAVRLGGVDSQGRNGPGGDQGIDQ